MNNTMWIIIVFLDDWIIIFRNNTIYWLSGTFGGGQPLYPTLHPLSASALVRSPSTLAIGYFPIGGTHLLEAGCCNRLFNLNHIFVEYISHIHHK